ncbi:MAG: hypothetical protein JWQ40_1195 [Segetibacter sp.]|nr:hypothetical protein [Segetibacter sp.]
MACIIKIGFEKTPEEIINKAKLAIEGQNGTFTGDSTRGSFRVAVPLGSVAAEYIISGNELEVTVTKKPFIVSCRKIESFLKDHINM